MYDHLARIYDSYQKRDWVVLADYICRLQEQYSLKKTGDGQAGRPILLDLGCGSGEFCLEMARRGYDPIGIDSSIAMLETAQQKSLAIQDTPEGRCLFLAQDISAFELFGTCDLAVCLTDTINHLLDLEDVNRMLKLVFNYLNPGCLFIFDRLSLDYFKNVLGDNFYFQDQPEYTLFWQNNYDDRSGLNQADITVFYREGPAVYRRADTTVRERYYAASNLEAARAKAGFEQLVIDDLLLKEQPQSPTERIFHVLRKPLFKE